MQAGKETAANIAASARSGMEKTKAVALEKVEQMKTRDPMMKDMATQKKESKIEEVERQKQGAMQQNKLARHEGDAGGFGGGFTAIGDPTAVGGAGQTEGGHVPGTGHAPGGQHIPGTDHASGGENVPVTGHVPGGEHIPGTGHAFGGQHVPSTGPAPGGEYIPGTGHAPGGEQIHGTGTGHTGHRAI